MKTNFIARSLNLAAVVATSTVLALAIVACASTAPTPATPTAPTAAAIPAAAASLYERLGGKPAIEAVVDTFLGNVAGDARIAHRFALSDLGALRGHLIDQICQATGGPCTYKGRDMKTTHKNQHVTDAEFGALVEDLIKALDTHKVPATEKGELLAALGGMKADIVGQ